MSLTLKMFFLGGAKRLQEVGFKDRGIWAVFKSRVEGFPLIVTVGEERSQVTEGANRGSVKKVRVEVGGC